MAGARFLRGLAFGVLALAWLAFGASVSAAQETPQGTIEFVSRGTPGPNSLYFRGIGADSPGGLLQLEVWANEVTDLYGLSFALRFPHNLLRFPKSRPTVFVEGPFLGDDGAEETVLLVRQSEREIIVGHSRLGQTAGVSGSGHLMTLEFRGRGVAGSKLLRLRRNEAFDSSGAEIEDFSWLRGKVVVTVAEETDPEPKG